MSEAGYPGYLQHRAEHVKLTQEVIDYQNRVVRGEIAVSVNVLKFLGDWLRQHIRESDQKVGAYLRARAS